MIYATALPIEKYSVNVEGTEYGLYPMYKDQPELLALIAICTPIPYDYEGCRPPGLRRVDLSPHDVYFETLKYVIKGKTIAELLATLNPLEFYEHILNEDVSTLPLVKKYLKGEPNPFRLIVGARAAAWGLSYRGPLTTEGKVVRVSFRGVDVPRHLQELHQKLKEELMHDGK